MTLFVGLLLAALAVTPADRLALADRLFNRGETAAALAEYEALLSAHVLPPDVLGYRRAEALRVLGDLGRARSEFTALLTEHPLSEYAPRARLGRALVSEGAERAADLRALDDDSTPLDLRAEALYRLGVAERSPELLERALKLAPAAPTAAYAKFELARLLAESTDKAVRLRAAGLLLDLTHGKDQRLSEESMFLAAVTCYNLARYSEARTLFKRLLKTFPASAHAAEATRLLAWCAYLSGRHQEALELCAARPGDDYAYLRAVVELELNGAAGGRRLLEGYLAEYAAGKYRREAELALARLDFQAAKPEQAVAAAKRAAALSGSAVDRLRLAWALECAAQADAAVAEYLAVASAFPGTAEAAEAGYRRGLLEYRRERFAAAELALKEALANAQLKAERRAAAAYWRGVAAVRLGHGEEGAESLREALKGELDIDCRREARLLLADLDLLAGRETAARAAYAELVREGALERLGAAKIRQLAELLSLTPEGERCAAALVTQPSAEWRQVGWALKGAAAEGRGEFAAAADAYQRALAEAAATEPLKGAALALGRLKFASGDLAAAEASLSRAVELNAEVPLARAEAYLLLARLKAQQADGEAARAYATVVAELFAETPFAAEARQLLDTLPGEK